MELQTSGSLRKVPPNYATKRGLFTRDEKTNYSPTSLIHASLIRMPHNLIVKLRIDVLILLLSSTDGSLLRYMYVFRIMLNVQEKFVSGILSMLVTS